MSKIKTVSADVTSELNRIANSVSKAALAYENKHGEPPRRKLTVFLGHTQYVALRIMNAYADERVLEAGIFMSQKVVRVMEENYLRVVADENDLVS